MPRRAGRGRPPENFRQPRDHWARRPRVALEWSPTKARSLRDVEPFRPARGSSPGRSSRALALVTRHTRSPRSWDNSRVGAWLTAGNAARSVPAHSSRAGAFSTTMGAAKTRRAPSTERHAASPTRAAGVEAVDGLSACTVPRTIAACRRAGTILTEESPSHRTPSRGGQHLAESIRSSSHPLGPQDARVCIHGMGPSRTRCRARFLALCE